MTVSSATIKTMMSVALRFDQQTAVCRNPETGTTAMGWWGGSMGVESYE
jgi:hypothetical protein